MLTVTSGLVIVEPSVTTVDPVEMRYQLSVVVVEDASIVEVTKVVPVGYSSSREEEIDETMEETSEETSVGYAVVGMSSSVG